MATARVGYSYATTGAFFDDVTPEQAGNAFPDNTFRHHLVWKPASCGNTRRTSACAAITGSSMKQIEDFHYTGLTNVVDNNIYLATIPESYTAHVFGIFFQYSY